MTSLTFGNGLVGSIGYDEQKLNYRITSMNIGNVVKFSYDEYDANGNIKSIKNKLFDPADTTKNKSYTYDALDRLATATSTGLWGSLGWAYDGVGNRLTENSTTYSYTLGTNKLIGVGGTSFGYDNNGNTTTEGARQYIYNQNQRLIQVNDGATTANYAYNGNGQRVKKDVNGVVTIFHYSQGGQILAESNSSGTFTAEYVYLNGQPLAKIDSSGVNYIHTDHLGTPMVMTDATGAKVWEIETRPFGDGAIITGSATLNFRFSGQYSDQETGNNQNGFRDYAPPLGRYIEADLIGLAGGLNLYAYGFANPLAFIDPKGLEVFIIPGRGPFTFRYPGVNRLAPNQRYVPRPVPRPTPAPEPIPSGNCPIGPPPPPPPLPWWYWILRLLGPTEDFINNLPSGPAIYDPNDPLIA